MTDVLDQAQQVEEAEREASIALAVAPLKGEGSADCGGCGDPIEALRRAAMPSARRCAECQAARERRAREFRS
ncbi:MAG: transcriptional regulator, TraR/DksA family [Caulobacter sp.]|nr:transcriptional regulator, TraR/DksA family [Caulobacter sp.]